MRRCNIMKIYSEQVEDSFIPHLHLQRPFDIYLRFQTQNPSRKKPCVRTSQVLNMLKFNTSRTIPALRFLASNRVLIFVTDSNGANNFLCRFLSFLRFLQQNHASNDAFASKRLPI